MKELTLLVWLTQLGISVVAPLAGFVLLAVWLRSSFGWENWVIWVGIGLGILSAITNLFQSLRALARLSDTKVDKPQPVSFNDHD